MFFHPSQLFTCALLKYQLQYWNKWTSTNIIVHGEVVTLLQKNDSISSMENGDKGKTQRGSWHSEFEITK
jgi:hypothetical protein